MSDKIQRHHLARGRSCTSASRPFTRFYTIAKAALCSPRCGTG